LEDELAMNKSLRRFRWTAGIAVGVVMLAIVGPAAHAAEAGRGKLVPASDRLAGFTGGQLLGEEVRQLIELPLAENPFRGVGDSCFATATKDKVLIAWTREEAPICTVKPGTPIFLMTYFWECSNTEGGQSFGGETEAGQRQCALDVLRETGVFDAILVSVDGRRPVDIYSDRYLAVSPQMTASLPTPNILEVNAQETTFVAAAWVAMIRPLPPGTHTIRVEYVTPDGSTTVSEVTVNVVPGQAGSASH
jgi:hypothetical protein